MAKIKKHSLWAIIVVSVFVVWIVIIVFVMLFVHPKIQESFAIEISDTRSYPGVFNECPDSKPNAYYLNMSQCRSLVEIARNECPSKKVCVVKCPALTYKPNLTDDQHIEVERSRWKVTRDFAFCLSTLKGTTTVLPPQSFDEYLQKIKDGFCPDKIFRSKPFFTKVCIPIELRDAALRHLIKAKTGLADDMGQRTNFALGKKRRSYDMFIIWVLICFGISVLFICLYLVLFVHFIRFTVYCSLFLFLVVLITGLCISIRMAIESAREGNVKSEDDPNLTLGINWICWTVLAAVIVFISYLYFDFFRKCYYSIPKAVQFLIYVNRGIGGIRSAVAFIFFGILLQVILIICFVQLLIVIYDASHKIMRLTGLTHNCICINGYEEGSLCTKKNFTASCKDRVSSGPCFEGSCDLYSVELATAEIFLIAALVATTYYLMWFVKGSIDMIIGTTFVHWYRDNFKSTIPFRQLMKKTVYCFKYQSGTLALGSLVMFSIGIFHVLFQFIEHLVLFTVEIKKVRRKKILVSLLDWLSKTTSPLIYIEAGAYNTSYGEASKRIDLRRSNKTKNVRLINRLVDMVLFICALLVVLVNFIGLVIVYAFPHTFIKSTYTMDVFNIMSSPMFVMIVLTVSSYFLVANVLSMYSISVNAIFLCYISDIPADVSRKRKYPSSKVISEDTHPDKYDVLGKLNDDLGESVAVGDKGLYKGAGGSNSVP